MKAKIKSFFLLFAILLVFASCSNPMGDGSSGNSTITIDLGSGEVPSRGVQKSVSISDLKHTLTFSGPTGVQTRTVTGGGTVQLTVVAGTWYIDVEAYLGDDLYAVGSTIAVVKAGQNTNVSIQMNVVWSDSAGTPRKGGTGTTGTSGLTADPIAFTDTSGTIIETYSLGGTYTNAITTAHSGTGAITYTSSDTSVATVDASGVVTLLKGGTTTIKAEKAADTTYDGSWASYTLEVEKMVPNVVWPTISALTYVPGLTLGSISFSSTNTGTTSGTFSWALPTTTTLGDAGSKSYTMNFTVDSGSADFYADSYTTINFTVNKAAGAGVTAPTLASETYYGITINAVTVSTLPTNTGQVAEYAISTTSTLPTSGWQTTLTFGTTTTPLTAATYYIFARSQETTNYNAGTEQVLTITKKGSATLTISFTQISEQSMGIADITLSRSGAGGNPKFKEFSLDNPAQYVAGSIKWYFHNAQIGTGSPFIFSVDTGDSTNYKSDCDILGTQFLTVEVEKGGVPYSNYINLKIVD